MRLSTYNIFLTLIALFIPGLAAAQLKESLEVEGRYEKEILYPERLGRLPSRLRLVPPASDLSYSYKGVPANFVPSTTPIPSTAYGASRTYATPRGYLNLALGSFLNADVKAGYSVLCDEKQALNIWLRHSSTSLWKPYKELEDNHSHFSYQEEIGGHWGYSLMPDVILEAGVSYRLGYFNYYSLFSPENLLSPFPTQTLNDLSLMVSISDDAGHRTLSNRHRWKAAISARHFAFRTATRETLLHFDGGYDYLLGADPDDNLQPSSFLGIDADFRGLLYGAAAGIPEIKNYGNLRLSPHYRIANPHFALKIGLNAEMTFNANAANPYSDKSRYGVFHISPDVRFDYTGTRFDGWIYATGGQELQTLATLADRNLYCNPVLRSTTPVYVPVDARAGARLRPFAGAEIEAWIGFRMTQNVRGEEWYNPANNLLPQLSYDLKGLYAGGKIRYRYGSVIDVGASLEYSPQNASNGIYNGLDRPRWILNPRLEIYPVKAFNIGVEYEYRGVREAWSVIESPAESPDATPALNPCGLRMPDITCLNAHANYTFRNLGPVKGLTVGIEAKNLLNHHFILQPGMSSEGFAVSGNLQFLF